MIKIITYIEYEFVMNTNNISVFNKLYSAERILIGYQDILGRILFPKNLENALIKIYQKRKHLLQYR